MKALVIIKSILLIVVSSLCLPVSAETIDNAKVLISMPINLGETVDVSATFEGISPGAIKLGLGEAQVSGTANYTDLGQNKTRVFISWHSIKYQSGDYVENEPLTPRLISKVITDSNIDPNTSITISGDLSKVLESFKKAKNRAEAKGSDSSKYGLNEINNDEDEDRQISDLSPSGSSSGSNGTSNPSDSSNNNVDTSQNPNVALQSTQTVSCSPRIDESVGKVFKQEKSVTSADGVVISETTCKDTATSAPIITTSNSCGYQIVADNLFLQKRKYATLDGSNIEVSICTLDQADPQPTIAKRQDCDVLPNTSENVVYLKYKQVANIDEEDIEVTSCTVDINSSLPIDKTYVGCGVRHDFIASKSIQLEKLSFTENQKIKSLNNGECSDSNVVYPHYLTDQTCDVTVDNISSTVFIQQRVAYNNASNQVEYASSCAPISTNTVNVQKEYCEDKYEHDFLNNVSYALERSFYIHPSNGKTMLTGCQRSSTESYAHIFNEGSCTTTNDDNNLKTMFNKKRSIKTLSDGDIEISACEPFGNPVAYIPLSTSYKKVAESAVSNIYLNNTQDVINFLSRLSASEKQMYIGVFAGCNYSGMMTLHGLISNPNITSRQIKEDGYLGFRTDENNKAYNVYFNLCTIYNTTQELHTDFLRGDGSHYDQLTQTFTKIAG